MHQLKNSLTVRIMALVALLSVVNIAAAGEKLSYVDLVERMYDMKRLSPKPVPGEKGGCFSSWDPPCPETRSLAKT